MSAIGSVIPILLSVLPAGLDQSRNVPFASMVSKTKPAHSKSAVERPRSSAERATVVLPNFKFIRSFGFDSQTLLSQWNSPGYPSTAKRHSEQFQQSPSLRVCLCCGGDRYGHSPGFFNFVSIDFGKNNLLSQT